MDTLEEFTEQQRSVLERFVTNTRANVFALKNLPEVIKGALFSRYSRSTLGLRALLLKEFILNEDTAFLEIAGISEGQEADQQMLAIRKAQNFYDRILDGYGDDSIGELGGAHLAFEQVSMLAAKAIEEPRVGGSPLEKSSRYIYFDQMVHGEYLFYKEPVLMTSAYRELYLSTCNMLFDTYSRLIPELTEVFGAQLPRDPETSKVAYTASLRAKVLDCLRGLLPASTLTNVGVFGNGRFFEGLLQRLQVSSLAENQEIGRLGYEELSKVIPSFIRRAEAGHRHFQSHAQYMETLRADLEAVAGVTIEATEPMRKAGVRLVRYDEEAPWWVAAGLLFPHCDASLAELDRLVRRVPEEHVARILDAAVNGREHRRHKSPRALELAQYTFEILADFGSYRDLQRHRMLTQERQLLGCEFGYYVPEELKGLPAEQEYCLAMERAQQAWQVMVEDFPEEAQYVVPMGYQIHWMMRIDLRALQWMCELRSQPQGHPQYRLIAQHMAQSVCGVHPEFERFLRFVDYNGYDLGRFQQEVRRSARQGV